MNKNEITKEWGKLEKTIYEDSDFSIEITEIYKDNNGIERRYITTRDKNVKDFDKLEEKINKAISYISSNCILSNEWTDLGFCDFVPTGRITYKQLSKAKVEELLNILKGE